MRGRHYINAHIKQRKRERESETARKREIIEEPHANDNNAKHTQKNLREDAGHDPKMWLGWLLIRGLLFGWHGLSEIPGVEPHSIERPVGSHGVL